MGAKTTQRWDVAINAALSNKQELCSDIAHTVVSQLESNPKYKDMFDEVQRYDEELNRTSIGGHNVVDELTRHTDQYLKFALSFIDDMTLSEFEQMQQEETPTEHRYQVYHALRDQAYMMAIKELRSRLPEDPREQKGPDTSVTANDSALETLALAENRNEVTLG